MIFLGSSNLQWWTEKLVVLSANVDWKRSNRNTSKRILPEKTFAILFLGFILGLSGWRTRLFIRRSFYEVRVMREHGKWRDGCLILASLYAPLWAALFAMRRLFGGSKSVPFKRSSINAWRRMCHMDKIETILDNILLENMFGRKVETWHCRIATALGTHWRPLYLKKLNHTICFLLHHLSSAITSKPWYPKFDNGKREIYQLTTLI